jgi:DNA-binding MarR family transcriptional regulator
LEVRVAKKPTEDRVRRRVVAAVARGLRDLRIELAVLNHRVGSRVQLKDLDFDCLDVVARQGPLTPSALAGRVGVHAATMTGILDRLEAGGWISRTRAEDDRRAVLVETTPESQRELYGLFDGMNTRLEEICARYSDVELETIVDFLQATVEAGQASADELA